MIGVFGALTCVVTMMISIPIPATQGFINIGDSIVMFSGLLFGPIIGSIAGGVGSSLADIFLGYTNYAIPTLIIKGLEGFIVGIIANPRKYYKKINYRDIVGVVVGGLTMVLGYFLVEVMFYGFPSAFFETIFNLVFQFGLGAIIAIALIIASRKRLIDGMPQVFDKIFIIDAPEKEL